MFPTRSRCVGDKSQLLFYIGVFAYKVCLVCCVCYTHSDINIYISVVIPCEPYTSNLLLLVPQNQCPNAFVYDGVLGFATFVSRRPHDLRSRLSVMSRFEVHSAMFRKATVNYVLFTLFPKGSSRTKLTQSRIGCLFDDFWYRIAVCKVIVSHCAPFAISHWSLMWGNTWVCTALASWALPKRHNRKIKSAVLPCTVRGVLLEKRPHSVTVELARKRSLVLNRWLGGD